MATARPSFTKRQRETARRERQQLKEAKRAARKAAANNPTDPELDVMDDMGSTEDAPQQE